MLGDANFFGEGSLAGQALRMGSAAAMTDCKLLRIEKKAMMASGADVGGKLGECDSHTSAAASKANPHRPRIVLRSNLSLLRAGG
jgi:hypothetical protein